MCTRLLWKSVERVKHKSEKKRATRKQINADNKRLQLEKQSKVDRCCKRSNQF